MLGPSSSFTQPKLFATNATAQQMAVAPNTASTRLTQQQTHYLERVNKRKEKIRSMLDDSSPLMMHFSYEVDTTYAAQKNKELEHQLLQMSQNVEDIQECLDRFKRVTEKCPDLSTVAIVPIKGLPGLLERMQAGTAAHEKLSHALQLIRKDSQLLKTNSINMKKQMEEIRKRHSALSHRWLRIVKLIEDASMATGIYESNAQNQQNTELLLKQIEVEFKWNDWQQNLKMLHSQLNALLQSGQATSPQQPIDEKKAKALYDLLNLKAEAIEALSIETIKVDKNVQKMEEALIGAPQSKLN